MFFTHTHTLHIWNIRTWNTIFFSSFTLSLSAYIFGRIWIKPKTIDQIINVLFPVTYYEYISYFSSFGYQIIFQHIFAQLLKSNNTTVRLKYYFLHTHNWKQDISIFIKKFTHVGVCSQKMVKSASVCVFFFCFLLPGPKWECINQTEQND